MITKEPLVVKETLKQQIKEFVLSRRAQGFTVKIRTMFFTPLNGRKPRKIKVMVSAIKVEPFTTLKHEILRVNGTWI